MPYRHKYKKYGINHIVPVIPPAYKENVETSCVCNPVICCASETLDKRALDIEISNKTEKKVQRGKRNDDNKADSDC